MKTNNTFSIRRFWLLCQQSLIINKKGIGILIVGLSGSLFILLLSFQVSKNFRQCTFNDYFVIFLITFISLGIVFSSSAFSAFRSKEKSMFYLMLPSSTSEKYLLELLIYIVGYMILMPILFFSVAYLESHMVHMFNPDFDQFSFSVREFGKNLRFSFFNRHMALDIFGAIEFLFLIFAVFFTGASYFTKSPLSKTIFTGTIILTVFSFYSSFLTQITDMQDPQKIFGLDTLIRNNQTYSLVIKSIIDLSLLAMAWFKLKEKEV